MKKLMVVDDEFIVRVGLRSLINWEDYGYTIAADACNGEEALEKIAFCNPDIVLADLKMENMDGFELIRRCAREHPHIRFIVLSSHNEFEDVRKAMKLGAKDYIFKPTLNSEELLRVLGEVSGSEGPREEAFGTVIRENIQEIKSSLLRKWVKHTLKEEDVLAQFRTTAPKVNLGEPYFILYISIDEYEKQNLQGDIYFLKSTMENTIYQICEGLKAEVFNYQKGDMAIFVNTAADNGYLQETGDLFQKIREYCRRYLGLDVSGTISPVITGMAGMPEIMRICEDTLAQRTGIARLLPYHGGQRNEIARAREFIAGHLGERMGVQDVASAAGMSESYFSHLFKKETGHSVVDYINRIKMEKAAELLENRRIKVADVALQIGLDNPNYFSVIFKKVMGLSPQEYRERIKAGSGQ